MLAISGLLIFTNVADYEEPTMNQHNDMENTGSNEKTEEKTDEKDMVYTSQEQGVELDLSEMNFDERLSCPAIIEGEISGTWYSEGEFSIEVLQEGQVVEQLRAEAQGNWMTEDPVPFTSTFECEEYPGEIELSFQQGNPSGLAENEDQVVVKATIEDEEDSETEDADVIDDLEEKENDDSSLY